MDRRTFVSSAVGVLLAVALSANAQPAAKVPRIGVLFPGSPANAMQFVEAFAKGLRDNGYVEGQNIVVERRFGEGKRERIVEAAAELVRLKLDVIVTATDMSIAELKRLAPSTPIVMSNATDPVGTGFVASLAHPGGSITGIASISPELNAKRLELLKEAVPGLSRVAIMWNPDDRGSMLDVKETESAARALGLQLQSVEVIRAEAVVVIASALTYTNRFQIASLALQHRLPSMYGAGPNVEAGGLIAYGPSYAETWRRSATYVHKILQGSKPGDLAVEQPTTFEFVINLKTAKALGLALPPSLLRRADQVIQ
jgi:putative ABC transport system substrate-binding protein